MNKLIFFKSLEKAVKELPVDDQKMIIKEYEFRYQQEKMKGVKDKDIIASFGMPAEIIEAYLANKNEVLVNLNTELTTSDDSNDYTVDYETAKEELITEKEETDEKEETVVEVNPSLEIVPSIEEITVTDEIVEETTKEEIVEETVEDVVEETAAEEVVVEVNPNLEIEVPIKEETVVEEKTEKKEEKKRKKKKKEKIHKKIPLPLIPLWLILIVIVFVFDLLVGILYVPLVFVGFGIFLFGIYTIVGSIMFFMSASIFNGLFQAGIGVLIIILSVIFISLVNLMIKSSWKLLGKMFKRMRGK